MQALRGRLLWRIVQSIRLAQWIHQLPPRCEQLAVQARKRPNPPSGKDEARNGQPRYLRVATELKRGISNGTWPVGARLPMRPVRDGP